MGFCFLHYLLTENIIKRYSTILMGPLLALYYRLLLDHSLLQRY